MTGTGSARGPVHRAAKTTAGTGAGHHREAATTGAGAPGSQGKTNAATTATAGETETAGRARGTGRRAAGWSTPTRWGGPAASPGNGTRVGRAQPSTTIRSGWRGMVKQLPRTRTTRRSWLGCRPRRRRGSVPAPRHPAVLQFAPNRIPASSGQLPPALVSIGVVSIRRRQVLRRKHTRHGHRCMRVVRPGGWPRSKHTSPLPTEALSKVEHRRQILSQGRATGASRLAPTPTRH